MEQGICSLPWCEEPAELRGGYCAGHRARSRRGADLTKPLRPRRPKRQGSAVERFWTCVDRSGDCWIWTDATDNDGYGRFSTTVEGLRYYRAPRFSYWLAMGVHPGELWVLHHCDNPPCVRPDHLFLGSAADNNADMVAKGRDYYPTGDDHYLRVDPERISRGDDLPYIKLSDAAVAEIRRRWANGGVTQTALAVEYGVSVSHICNICAGKARVIPARRRAS
jgi:hypothetical protein